MSLRHQTFYFDQFNQAFFVFQITVIVQKQQRPHFSEPYQLILWLNLLQLVLTAHKFLIFILI